MMNRRTLISALLLAPSSLRCLFQAAGESDQARPASALKLRESVAISQTRRGRTKSVPNKDEQEFPDYIACFSKGLPQNQYGEVNAAAYKALLDAVESGRPADFERIPKGAGRKLSNPQAAFAFHLEGADPHEFYLPPAPSITSSQFASEAAELYWQALCRDVAFDAYGTSPLVTKAAVAMGCGPQSVFRGNTRAALTGPYLSQFLLKPIPWGTSKLEQKNRLPALGNDFLTSFSEWTQIQAGMPSWRETRYDDVPRYIRSGRDLAEWVHYDFPYQAFLSAAVILLDVGPDTVLNSNPFKSTSNPYRYSNTQEGFVTFGQAEITDWLARVTTAALKAAWCQKWMVHRRVRPEELGGLIQLTKTRLRSYPLSPELLGSSAVEEVFSKTGTYLLPQAYPEGCPLHPSYPAGHAVISGACSIILKAFFNEKMLLPACVVPNQEGTSLLPCPDYAPTVGAEIDKLAFNVALARNWAGIHFRSDDDAGIRLGEDVAISVLQDLVQTYTENFKGLSFTRIDGTAVHVSPRGEVMTA
jgi:hypothetical protein